MKPIYKFPFYGVDISTNFDYTLVEIVFKETPTEEQKVKIEKLSPSLLIYFSWENNCLVALSNDIRHYDIAKIYQTADGLCPEDDDCEERFTAANSQIFAFHTDIERWLKEIHEISPILLAHRSEEKIEDGITELSDWNIWSFEQFHSIAPYFDDTLAKFNFKSIKGEILTDVLFFINTYSTLKLDKKYEDYMYPGRKEFMAFEYGDIEPLKSIANLNYLELVIEKFCVWFTDDHQKIIEKYVTTLLSFEHKISKVTFEWLNEKLFIYFPNINSEIFKTIASKITRQDFIDDFVRRTHYQIENERPIKNTPFFEKLLFIPVLPSSVVFSIETQGSSSLKELYENYMYPGRIEFKAFEKGNIEPLKSITNLDYLNRTLDNFYYWLNDKHQQQIEKYVSLFLSFEDKVSKTTFKKLNQELFLQCKDINSETFKTIASKIINRKFINAIVRKAYLLIEDKKYIESIPLFKKLLLSPVEPDANTGFYINILVVFQKGITGLPTNINRNRLVLEKCLSKNLKNHSVFYNASCLYAEMEEYDKAYEMMKKSLDHYGNRDFMLSNIGTKERFKEFREKTDVIELLQTYNLEPAENPKPRYISNYNAFNTFDVSEIYNDGYFINFANIILINGHVNIAGEFNEVYKTLVEEHKIKEEEKGKISAELNKHIIEENTEKNDQEIVIEEDDKDDEMDEILVIVNGNLTADAITCDKNVLILVMGEVFCDNITHKAITEQGKTNFDFVPSKYYANKEILSTKIRNAFKDITLGNGIGLNEAQGIAEEKNPQELLVLRKEDEKTHWENILTSDLSRCRDSLIAFDSKGMQFHIPRFMIASLYNSLYDEHDFGINVSIALTSVAKLTPYQPDSIDQFSDLTKEQREAICAYLGYLLEDEEYKCFAEQDIRLALDYYWLKTS